jgi:hypothetical protein
MSHEPEDDLDAALREALRVEPGPEFLPRVRERLRQERPAPGWNWLPATLLAGAALVLVVALGLGAGRMASLEKARLATAPSYAPPAATLAPPPLVSRRGAAAPAAAITLPNGAVPRIASEPEVLVPEGQEAAIARFAAGIEALEQDALLGALARSPSQLADLRIEPLSIEPLARNGS